MVGFFITKFASYMRVLVKQIKWLIKMLVGLSTEKVTGTKFTDQLEMASSYLVLERKLVKRVMKYNLKKM